jgi:ABC-type lipoprotein release transport system permease subunit
MSDDLKSAGITVAILGAIVGVAYGVGLFIHSATILAMDEQCSTIAWRTARIANDISAGQSAYIACRAVNARETQ